MTVGEIAKLIGAEATALAEREILRVSGFSDATGDAIVFASDDRTLMAALTCAAGAVLAPITTSSSDNRLLRVRQPKYAFALCGKALAPGLDEPMLHPQASIHPSAVLGSGTRVGAGAVIEADVVIGADCFIASNVTLCRGVLLGDRVVVQPGAVLGSAGFGYVRNEESGEYLLFPQQGALVVEADVEIGANTTIDRGALGETRIGRGAKIDNLVHIGHNCVVGPNAIIAAQVGISGSSTVGKDAVLAGQVGLGDHVQIGDGVILGGQSGVFPGKTITGPGVMFGGTPAEPVREYLKSLARLRRLR